MSRGPHTFKQSDLTRALKAVQTAGLTVVRTEIHPDGRIVIVHEAVPADTEFDAYEVWQAKFDARMAAKD